ncbi:MAG: thioredoxin domain-containing protein [Vulcanisaeta sp. AZ3]
MRGNTGSTASTNKILLIAVIVLAVALVGVIVYFTVVPHLQKTSTVKTTSKPQTQQVITPTLAFEDSVKAWYGIECVYNKYGSNSTLSLINSIYEIAFRYIYAYERTSNETYLLVYPVAEYDYLNSTYSECSISANDTELVNSVIGTLSNINVVATELKIPSNLLGTPLFIVYNKANNITYILAGASPYVFYAINYSRVGNITTFTYQGQLLGYSFKANASQVKFINELVSSGLKFGSSKASVVVIEFLDPVCPYCSIFQVEYGGYLEHLINDSSIFYVVYYFPTHALLYGCSSPTIAQMLGPYCG